MESKIKVQDVMTRDARSCHPGDSLSSAALAMCKAHTRFLPVVDEAGRPVSVITDGDICLVGATDHRRLRDLLVRDAMSQQIFTCRPGDTLEEAALLMSRQRIRHLPVVGSEGRLEGVLSITDLVLCAEEQPPEETRELRREIVSALRSISGKSGGGARGPCDFLAD